MTRKQAANTALVCACALTLSGCVAAAIPLVAGGALVRTSTDGKDAGETAPPPPAPAAPQPSEPPVAETVEVAKPAVPAQEKQAITPPPAVIRSVPASPTGKLPPIEAPTPEATNAFIPFIQYAKKVGQSDDTAAQSAETSALSAVLSDPVALDGKRAACAAKTTTVVIDLDPGSELYAPGNELKSDPELMLGLGQLRANDIKVAWLSGASAAYAGDLRMALRTSGLDALGRDTLLLMRYPDDRKQTRRKELAAETCLIAIAGDSRPDFDERFKYLRNPEDARGLEVLFNNGWFLVPTIVGEAANTARRP